MSAQTHKPGPFLPTVYGAFKPVEEYLDRLETAEGAPAAPRVPVRPIDALLIRLMASYQPARPVVVDLTAAATLGAAAALCLTDPSVRRVAVPRGVGGAWRFILSRFLKDRDPATVGELVEADGLSDSPAAAVDPEFPTLVLTAPTDRSGAELAAEVEHWLEAVPRAVVLVLGLGEVGNCPGLAALAAACTGSPRLLALPRELAPALAGSRLAVVGRRSNPVVAEALFRTGRLFADNFRFLDLVKETCLAVVQRASLDDPCLAVRWPGPDSTSPLGGPAAVKVLQQALDTKEKELLALTAAMDAMIRSRAFRVAVRVSRVFKAPRWFLRKAKGGLRVFRQAGLRGVIARTADKLAKKAA
jgi:hypothetical protein